MVYNLIMHSVWCPLVGIAYIYIYICIYETRAWAPHNVRLSVIVVESLLCKFKWRLFVTGDPFGVACYG